MLLAAIDGFEFQKLRIDAQIFEIEQLLDDGNTESEASPVVRQKHSAPKAPKASKKKRKLSAAGRAAIVAALKKRWAAKKAEQAAVAKKGAVGKKARAAAA